jgi:hypothetical protein
MDRDWGGLAAEKEWYIEAADFKVSTAEGIKEGGVARGAESARDVGCERSVFEVCDRRAVGLIEKAVMGGGQVGKMCGVSGGWWGGGGGMWSVATHSR